MRQFYYLLILFTLINFLSNAQTRTEIKGLVTDTYLEPLVSASVMILDVLDSSYLTFTQADQNGYFSITEKFNKPFKIKITYLGYFSYEKIMDPKESSQFDLGNIRLAQMNNMLSEVVIKEAKDPVKYYGDTIEFDVSSIKFTEGSSLEDLLRKLLGVIVGLDGSITVNGQRVNKVNVDGKHFFGDDPTIASRNLPAEGVLKVQIFNEITEQEKMTGIISDKNEKTINIELKEDFKKNKFGKIIAGMGARELKNLTQTSDQISKWELKGNYNKFNEKLQLSFIGCRNNTGRNGINWNDDQDLGAQHIWDWNSTEDLFGFSNYRVFSLGLGDRSDELSTSSIYFGDATAGIPNNTQIGLNFNYDYHKLKISTMYTYNKNDLLSDADRKQKLFLQSSNYFTNDHIAQDLKNGSHRAEFIFENDIDSLSTIVFKIRGNAVSTNAGIKGMFNYKNQDDYLTRILNLNQNSDRLNLGWQGVLFYKLKFNNRRNLGINLIYNNNQNRIDSKLYSNDYFYSINNDSISIVDEIIKLNTSKSSIKSSIFYVEPITKDVSFQLFYNFINMNDNFNRNAYDIVFDTMTNNKYGIRNNHQSLGLNKVGIIFQYGKYRTNITTGLAYQSILMEGRFQEGIDSISAITRHYDNIVVTFSTNCQIAKNKRIGFRYNENIQEPSIRELSTIVDNSNPLFIRIGNPKLKPENLHQVNIYFYGNNLSNAISYNISVNYSYFQNRIISELTIDTFLITTNQSINFRGGHRFGCYIGFNFPIIKNKFTTRINLDYSFEQTNSITNAVLNDSKTSKHGIGLQFLFTPNDKFSIYLDNNLNFSTTSYSIEAKQNYYVLGQSYNFQVNAKLILGIFLNGSFNYHVYMNKQYNSQYDVPILNASINKPFLKNNRMELRLSMYDLLNKSISIKRAISSNQITEIKTNLLSRYFLFSLIYYIKGSRATDKG